MIQDENSHWILIAFGTGEGLPAHKTNTTVYMAAVRSALSISLGYEEAHVYPNVTVIKIQGTRMNAANVDDDSMELMAVKTTAPAALQIWRRRK